MRRHWLFIILLPIATLLMTAPTASIALDLDTPRVPTRPSDIFMKYWDAWYFQEILAGRADYYHTDLLFYPESVSLAYHNFSLPHMLAFGGLQAILPPVNAYLVAFLLIIVANAVSAYIFLCRLMVRPSSAALGALAFGLSPYVLNHQEHPDLALAASIPLALYGLQRAFAGDGWRWLVFAGVAAGVTAFVGMYVFICLLITLGTYALILAAPHWRERRVRGAVCALMILVGGISLLRVYPMIADRDLLGDVLDKKAGAEQNNDLLAFFLHKDHPLQRDLHAQIYEGKTSFKHADGYLGYAPILLIGVVWWRRRQGRDLYPWLGLALLFVCLRLGSQLTVAGVSYPAIALPKRLLDSLLPWIFESFWDTSHFQIGILLPWAALMSLSADWLLERLSPRKGALALALILLAVGVEYYSPTVWHYSTNPRQLAWIDWLGAESSGAETRLIHLPMGRNNAKRYGYFQTFNRYPHVEGLASRTPPQAYAAIDGNLLLRSWRAGDSLPCHADNAADWLAAAADIRAPGFTHIIYHRQLIIDETVFASFDNAPSVYDDSFVTIFAVDDLPLACADNPALLDSFATQHHLYAESAALAPPASMTALTINSDSLATLRATHSQMRLDLEHPSRRAHADEQLAGKAVVSLAYNPQLATEELQPYRDWLARDFRDCGAIAVDGELRMDLWLRQGFPCELVIHDAPLQVDYDNGLRLGNLLLDRSDDSLDLNLLWRSLPQESSEGFALSLQLFDSAGEKVFGQDRPIYRSDMAHHQLDISSLAAGEYRAKLIVYGNESRKSVPGIDLSSGTRFQRELDLGWLQKE